MTENRVKAHCNECVGERFHLVLADAKDRWTDEEHEYWIDLEYQILKCAGCGTICFRKTIWDDTNSEYRQDSRGNVVENYIPEHRQYPPRVSRRLPKWADMLPERIRSVLEELFRALQTDCIVLATIGSRTVLDEMIVHLVGDVGTFQAKLDELVSHGWIGSQQRDVLEAALNAGSAAAHRGHRLTAKQLNLVIDIVEHALQAAYVLGNVAKEIRKVTPKRKKKVKK